VVVVWKSEKLSSTLELKENKMKKFPELSSKLLYIALISGLLIIIISVIFLLAGNANAFTDHRFLVNTDRQGEFFIDSFPDEMNNIPIENYPYLLINFCREKGVWDKRGIIAGEQNCSSEKVNSAEQKIIAVMKAIDKVLPKDEGIISFSYILCYHDVVIYFEEDYTMEQMCEIAEKLNIERMKQLTLRRDL
jgi:hypothetical protein